MSTLASVRSLRPTRRGIAVAVVAVLAFALGATAGARSLNAVVVPALVGLAAAAVQLARADAPTVKRSIPESGFAGATRRVTVDVDSDVPCRITERVPDGVSVDGAAPSATVGHGGGFTYEIELERRGAHELGPATCRLTDSLGLFARRVDTEGSVTALVYPDVYVVEAEALADVVRRGLGDDRASFDRLREFSPGDAMGDIHWRASAKRAADEFLVAEYASRSEVSSVEIAGEAAAGSVDAMASTVASVATHLQDAGVGVAVTVPGGRVVAHSGDAVPLLRLLALTDDGRIDGEARADADIVVSGEGGNATVSVADREVDFDSLVGASRSREVVA